MLHPWGDLRDGVAPGGVAARSLAGPGREGGGGGQGSVWGVCVGGGIGAFRCGGV